MVEHLSQGGLVAVTWVGFSLGVVFTSLRIFTRVRRINRLLVDDYLVLFALALLFANAILQTIQAPHLYYMVNNPEGVDIRKHVLEYRRYEFAIVAIFWSVLWSIKASLLALYYALFDGLHSYRLAWHIVAMFVLLTYIGCWMGLIFACHPPSAFFKYGQCTKPIDEKGTTASVSYSTTADIVTDLMVMALPMGILWKAKLNCHQRLGLGAVFCFGLIIIAISIARAIEIAAKVHMDQIALAVWGVTESSISTIIGCLPALKCLLGPRSCSKSCASKIHASSESHLNSKCGARRCKGRSLTKHCWEDMAVPLQSRNACCDFENIDNSMQVTIREGEHVDECSHCHSHPSKSKSKDIIMFQEFTVVCTDCSPGTGNEGRRPTRCGQDRCLPPNSHLHRCSSHSAGDCCSSDDGQELNEHSSHQNTQV